MTKKQKTWLWVFLGLFIVPEVLWSPILNYLYSVFSNSPTGISIFRSNFLINYNFENLYYLIICIQSISIFSCVYIWLSIKKSVSNKMFFWFILSAFIAMSIVLLFILYLLCISKSMSFF
jgi:hypothetical protein